MIGFKIKKGVSKKLITKNLTTKHDIEEPVDTPITDTYVESPQFDINFALVLLHSVLVGGTLILQKKEVTALERNGGSSNVEK